MQWVDLFHPFTVVESLRISRELGTRIAPLLQELTEPQAEEVIPALNSLIFLRSSSRHHPSQDPCSRPLMGLSPRASAPAIPLMIAGATASGNGIWSGNGTWHGSRNGTWTSRIEVGDSCFFGPVDILVLVDYNTPGICVFISLLPLFLRLTIISHHLYDTLEDFSNAITLYSTSLASLLIHSRYNYQQRILLQSESASLQGGALQDCKNSTGVTRSELNIL